MMELNGDPRSGPYVVAVEHLASGALFGHAGFSPFGNEVEVSCAIAEEARRRAALLNVLRSFMPKTRTCGSRAANGK